MGKINWVGSETRPVELPKTESIIEKLGAPEVLQSVGLVSKSVPLSEGVLY